MTGLREFGESAASAVLERVGRGVSRVQERKPLPSDLLESEDAYLVVFDAPGTTRSDVQVRFVEGAVEVRVDRFRDFHEGYEMRFPGRGLSLDGSVTLPGDAAVDAEDASATLTDSGVLKVRIPKAEPAAGTAVTVEDVDEVVEQMSPEDLESEITGVIGPAQGDETDDDGEADTDQGDETDDDGEAVDETDDDGEAVDETDDD